MVRGRPARSARGIVRHLPTVDSLFSLANQLGITPLIISGFLLVGGLAVTAWAYLESELPAWALVLVAILAIGVIAFALERILALWAGVKARLEVDRDELADEAHRLSGEIRALVGQHSTAIQKGWSKKVIDPDKGVTKTEHEEAVGRLIEQYRYKYENDAWKVLWAADHVIGMDKSDLWHVSNGVSSQLDLERMANLLSKVSGWVRYGKPEGAERKHAGL